MRALIFAAGRGERMRPLTDHLPKPLLAAGGKTLIEWHIERLAAAGFGEIVINTAYLGARIHEALGDGTRYGVRIDYSHEGDEPLETGGGLLHALPKLGHGPFLAINSDIWTDFPFSRLTLAPDDWAHIVLVDNPPQHPSGDFVLSGNRRIQAGGAQKFTFAGIGVYRPELIENWQSVIGETTGAAAIPPRFPLAPLLRAAMAKDRVSGEHYKGVWADIGTPERWERWHFSLRTTIPGKPTASAEKAP